MEPSTNSTQSTPNENHDVWDIARHYDGSNTKLNIVALIGLVVLLSLLWACCRLMMHVRKRRRQSEDYKYSAVNTLSVDSDVDCDDMNDHDVENPIKFSSQSILHAEINSNNDYGTDSGVNKVLSNEGDYYKLLNLTPKYDIFAKKEEDEVDSEGNIEMHAMGEMGEETKEDEDTELRVVKTLVENNPNGVDPNCSDKSYINANSAW